MSQNTKCIESEPYDEDGICNFQKITIIDTKKGSFGILDYKCTSMQVPSLFLSGCWWFYVR